jgi:hypothetical protein
MKATCTDRERVLSGEAPELFAAFEAHAQGCRACANEIAAWNRIAQAGPSLRKTWDSPELWPAIRQRLAEESQTPAARGARRPWLRWLPAAAMAALFGIAAAGLLVFRNSGGRDPLAARWQTTKDPILAESAANDVDAAEKSYVDSIERLSRLAEPRLLAASTPIELNYRERLAVLDSAIADLRSSIEQNRYNTHLRRELLTVYQEKQKTLQDLMKEVKS